MASFTPEFLDAIREQVSIVDVVSRHVSLKRRGREFVGLSPFKQERTPSFTVVPHKGFFHCFSSGEHGDVIGFVMRLEGLSFPEAVEKLALEAGLELPRGDPEEEKRAVRRRGMLEALEAATAFHERELRMPGGKSAMDYLLGRGLTMEMIVRFRLGWAPASGAALAQALVRGGFESGMLVEAGVLRAPDGGGQPGAWLRGRVVFPITDRRGRPVAFGGRTLGDGQPKYLNTPESPVFRKREMLYGLSQALEPAWREKEIVVVEGYMDAIALAQEGFGQAVASLGTAFDDRQFRELWKIANEPVFCFDGDEAGQRAARRVAERALTVLEAGKSLRFVKLPEGRDPDDLVRKEGPAAFRELVNGAGTLVDLLWRSEIATVRPQSAGARAGCLRTLMELCGRIPDRTVRQLHEVEIQHRCQQEFGITLDLGAAPSARPASNPGRSRTPAPSALADIADRHACGVVAALVNHPVLVNEFAEEVGRLEFEAPVDGLVQALILAASESEDEDAAVLRQRLLEAGHGEAFGFVTSRAVFKHAFFARADLPEEEVREGVRKALRSRELKRMARETEGGVKGGQYDEEDGFEKVRALREQMRQAGSVLVLDDKEELGA